MALLFQNKVLPAFAQKVKDISYKLGVDPDQLMFVMDYETGGTFSSTAQHPGSLATGLIQFLPSTAIDLGTTIDELKKMSAYKQLDYVYEYLYPYKGDMDDVYSTYLAVFYPDAIDEADTFVFPSNVVKSNSSFFKTGNTKSDFKKGIDNLIRERVPVEYQNRLLKKKELFCRYIKERLSSAA